MKINAGTIVRHSAKFCQSAGWHTPPINGIVIRVLDAEKVPTQVLLVWFCDAEAGHGSRILVNNLEVCPTNATVTKDARANLLAEYQDAENKGGKPEFCVEFKAKHEFRVDGIATSVANVGPFTCEDAKSFCLMLNRVDAVEQCHILHLSAHVRGESMTAAQCSDALAVMLN